MQFAAQQQENTTRSRHTRLRLSGMYNDTVLRLPMV